jgi:hypothetical protein
MKEVIKDKIEISQEMPFSKLYIKDVTPKVELYQDWTREEFIQEIQKLKEKDDIILESLEDIKFRTLRLHTDLKNEARTLLEAFPKQTLNTWYNITEAKKKEDNEIKISPYYDPIQLPFDIINDDGYLVRLEIPMTREEKIPAMLEEIKNDLEKIRIYDDVIYDTFGQVFPKEHRISIEAWMKETKFNVLGNPVGPFPENTTTTADYTLNAGIDLVGIIPESIQEF